MDEADRTVGANATMTTRERTAFRGAAARHGLSLSSGFAALAGAAAAGDPRLHELLAAYATQYQRPRGRAAHRSHRSAVQPAAT